ncbi:MAG: alpha/beta hydrolase [Verrucomicrobia bacterium]|jgi:acetyl esterase/lipase|nr:alpha/beta hydrolase [Verrucomicrobiota bacterium]
MVLWVSTMMFLHAAQGQITQSTTMKQSDLIYAKVGELELKLDLYFPKNSGEQPLIVWIHGGAWRAGDKSRMPLESLVADGFAVASVDYRLTPVARFPANVHDIKAAIRYLRANSETLRINAQSIVIAGASAGGHLAALVGVTNGHSALEGELGNHLNASSDVQAIVSFYGASNLTTILSQSTPHGLGVRIPALQLLLGAQPEDSVELAQLASPVFHVEASDPPLLLIHGDQDPQMPINQSHELVGLYEKVGASVQMKVIHSGTHGGAVFYDETRLKWVKSFLNQHLTPSR